MADKQTKGRAIGPRLLGAVNPAAKLKPEDVEVIRGMAGPHKDIAVVFGVSKSLISAIKRGEVWIA